MARNLILRSSSVFRHAIQIRVRPLCNPFPNLTTSTPHPSKPSLFATATAAIAASQLSPSPPFHHSRSLCSASAPSDIVLVNSEEEFNNILNKVQDNSLHAIFYFTAAWCGPCRFISPIVGDLSKKYPHVTTYKIDIDQPRLHFFQNGKKADELIGADSARLIYITEKLFKKD